ncbi:MAG: hypothetical protein Q7V00_05550 [Sulfurimicrobium sp.]|nr:hypothetical protein [Sulfurimicrobium sp.]MDP1705340.1 hypothetical protein [Sulfurimicrobium sp.]MDP2197826.1 hypothetical protein [Sulfurimicrobium sp.]MDP3687719.1 hypothetical protein [Sulfurimicrobium sp.]
MHLHAGIFLAASLMAAQGMAMADEKPGAKHSSQAPSGMVNARQSHDHGAGAGSAEQPAAPGQGKRQGRDWTKYPLITPVMRKGERDRMSTGLTEKNIATDYFEVFAPDSSVTDARRKVPVEAEGTVIKALPKLGNYYWVAARQEKDGEVIVASTPYYFGEPGPAPTRLLLEQKYELEIIPQPLPREHGAWRESEKWQFLLRFNGQPLANKALRMETEFGTRTAFTSDGKGMVTVLFPRDFKPAEKTPGQGGHSHGPRRAKFVLAAEHDDGGKHYLTSFNYTYSADPDRNRDLLAGLGFGVFGMLLAAPLLRRKKAENNKSTKEA